MGLFNRRKSAALIFGQLKHSNNNENIVLVAGSKKRYLQLNDVEHATKTLFDRINITPEVTSNPSHKKLRTSK